MENVHLLHESFLTASDRFSTSKEAINAFIKVTNFKKNKFYELKKGNITKKDIPHIIKYINSTLSENFTFEKLTPFEKEVYLDKDNQINMYSKSDTIKSNKVTSFLLKSTLNRQIYLETINSSKIKTKEYFLEKYGKKGLKAIEKLFLLNAIKFKSKRIVEGNVRASYTSELKEKIISDTIDSFCESSKGEGIFDGLYGNVTKEEALKINSILRKSMSDIQDIINNSNGDQLLSVNIVTDTIT